MNYHDRQAEQFRKFLHWVKAEGGTEGPTQLSTLLQPQQMERLEWLKERATGRILECGCNYGFVLAYVGGHVGIDINPMNIELARLLAPDREFHVGDILKLPFQDHSFDSVLVPDTLEHLDFPDGVSRAIAEAQRVTRQRILITMPDGREDSEDACNFKHLFLLDEDYAHRLLDMLPGAELEYRAGFALVQWSKPPS